MTVMRIALLLSAAMLSAAPYAARAGDAADLEILGFSADGGIFAFEQYGEQDGSGFPYAERFYIDTAKDAYLPGSPVRVRIESEDASIDEARQAARAKGESIVADAVLAQNRGYTAAMNPIGELSADPFRVVVNTRPLYPRAQDPVEFRLEETDVPAAATCDNLGPVKGFRLTSIDGHEGGVTKLLHDDKSIPASRGCPLGYSIGAVQTYSSDVGETWAAVLLTVRSFGFEGPDYRWLAVTVPLDQ